ncbi:ATP-dependent RecD-like DNA helicase [Candidatus Aerophobetes bacterium]|nr:ATP-dependent RecD-like DNA helicase [Candidatus Aerophobetes bacterium]
MEKIEITIERIVYYNPKNDYLVARFSSLRYPGRLLTLVGNIAEASSGQALQIEGWWVGHPKYGKQFKINTYKKLTPITIEGIKKYLGSGMIKGVGPVTADRIVGHFGKDSLEIIEKSPKRLEEVPGIGPKRKEKITSSLREQEKIKEIMVFLHSYGVSSLFAVKIYKAYGEETIEKLRENPYQLVEDIFGIGFKTADSIAANLGIKETSLLRIKAGIRYVLTDSAGEGHIFLPRDVLKEKASKVLNVDVEAIKIAIQSLVKENKVITEDDAVYFPPFYYAEKGTARKIAELLKTKGKAFNISWEKLTNWLKKKQGIILTIEQMEAVKTALTEKIMVLTGGPGTGKTTTLRSIVLILQQLKIKASLAAPTGRAAKRLSEATGERASTLHKLLEFAPEKGFGRNEKRKLAAEFLIVDETSMMDILLMYAFLRALQPSCRLILVGDYDQLPAVGAGNVLKDIISSDRIKTVKLTHIFRQARKSLIVVNAHRINQGKFPYLRGSPKRDFYFLVKEEPEEVREKILNLCKKEIPRYFGLDPIEDVQVISPLYRGVVGVDRLNQDLQNVFNLNSHFLSWGRTKFKIGDKVMQLRNNYQKEVFNGDIGRISNIDSSEERLWVRFSEKEVLYEGADIAEICLAYAISVHKSQGSEYPAIVMPVITSHYIMLQRNLLYTALTRAKKLAILIGQTKALAIAVKNNKIAKRYTKLAARLKE